MAILPGRGIYIEEFIYMIFSRGMGKLLGSYIIKLEINMGMKRGY